MYARAHTPMKPNLEETLAKNGRKTFKVKCFSQRIIDFEWNSRGKGNPLYQRYIYYCKNLLETKRARIKVQKSLHLLKMNEGGDVQCVGQNKEHLLTGGSGKKRCKKSS